MKSSRKSLAVVATLLFVNLLTVSPAMSAEADKAQALAGVRKVIPDIRPEAVQPSPVPGIYQVQVPPQLFYISADGRFAFDGDIIDLNTGNNVSTTVRDKLRLAAVDAVGEDNMIIYGPKQARYTVSVFTDIDCGYCRKLHKEMPKYKQAGIRIRYLAFPRAGIGSESYKKAVAVWCADDRKQALTDAKNGKPVAMKNCPNPVAREFQLGQQLGVRGTPAIVMPSGEVIPGYVPASRLAQLLEQQQRKLAQEKNETIGR
jgi:thiol:disulfide interchange protein DsbC